MTRTFYRKEIERYGDCARVQIFHVLFDGEQYRQKQVADYETLSRGAARSATAEIKKLSADQVSA